MIAGGVLVGLFGGVVVDYLLVAMPRGTFDPAPDGLAVPWLFVTLFIVSVVAVGILVLFVVGRLAARAWPDQLRHW